ncbi:MAG: alpha/beta hydrolase [Alphaproteobacteria bacterium]|nr:MAG: alpha/beta hydrolase [Alphaproteobacteria bacterium]
MPSKAFVKIRRLLKVARFMDKVMRRQVTPLGLRENMQKNIAATEPDDVAYREVDAGGVPSAWLVPENYDGRIRVLHLHGGGYTAGNIDTHRGYAGHLAKASGAAVLVADYRLAPEDVFPAALEDGLTAYRYMRGNGPDGAGEAERLIIGGDSAGGGLTLAVLMALRDAGEAMPDGGSLLSPWADLVAENETMKTRAKTDLLVAQKWLKVCAGAYDGGVDRADPRLSPIFGDFSGLPPLDIHVGDAEVLLGDSLGVAEKAKAAGVSVTLEVWPEMQHIWQVLWPFLPEGAAAVQKAAAFVRGD